MPLVNPMTYFKAIAFHTHTHTVFLLCNAYVGNSEAAFLMFQVDEKCEGSTTLMFHKARGINY